MFIAPVRQRFHIHRARGAAIAEIGNIKVPTAVHRNAHRSDESITDRSLDIASVYQRLLVNGLIPFVGHIDVSAAIHRDSIGLTESTANGGEAECPVQRKHLIHHAIDGIGNIDISASIHCHPLWRANTAYLNTESSRQEDHLRPNAGSLQIADSKNVTVAVG